MKCNVFITFLFRIKECSFKTVYLLLLEYYKVVYHLKYEFVSKDKEKPKTASRQQGTAIVVITIQIV